MDGMDDYGAEEVWAAEEDRRYWEEQTRDIIERLREAARVLRERSEAATPGPWESGPCAGCLGTDHAHDATPVVMGGRGRYIVAKVGGPDAAYIATMHPVVGLALANWLDAQADTTCDCGVDEFALAVANLILGTARNIHSALPF